MEFNVELILLIGTLVLLFWLMVSKPRNYPPGPPRWPIIGNVLQMKIKGQSHLGLAKLHKNYGDVVGLFIFNHAVILVSGVDAIREVCFRDDLSGRTEHEFRKIIHGGKVYGVTRTTGEIWKVQRRFTLQHLRDLGFGKRSLERVTHEEIQALFDDIDEISGGPKNGFANPVNFHELLGGAGINVLWEIIAGKRYQHKDPDFQNLITAVQKLLQTGNPGGSILSSSVVFAKLFPTWTGFERYKANMLPIVTFLENEINDHKKTIDYENPRDFIDIYLTEIEKQKGNPDTSFNEMQLKQLCGELFVAGTDTTLNTLSFAMLYMLLYPHVQKKVQDELDEVVGRDRMPSLEDRTRLPYTEATIHEIFRLSSIASTSLPHSPLTTENHVKFRGYHIPKGARILLNLFDLHHDPKIWNEPENFMPERFLRENGKTVNREALIPFGAGKRACLGESLARNNVFLFFTSVLQRYKLRVPDGQPKPPQEPAGTALLVPKKFEVKVQLRI